MARSKSRNIADLVGDRGDLNLNSNSLSSTFTDIDFTGTGSITLPVGTTAQRDSSPSVGMIRFNSTLGVFEGYKAGSWSEIGGGSSDTWTTDNFTGDGSTAAYTLTQAPASEDNVIAFIEGVFQNPADYVVSGTTITFDDNVPNGQKVVVHTVKATVSGNNLNLDEFTGNGSNTQFTLSINPIDERNTMVYIDGVYQNKDTYSLANQVLHFAAAPASSADIEVLTFTQTSINAPTSNSVGTTSLIDDSVTSAKLAHGLTLQGNTSISGSLDLRDSDRLHLGSDDDLALFHTGGNGVIHNTTGALRIRANTLNIQDYANEDAMITANSNDSVELYFNNIKKFETTNTGVTANGTVSATTFSGSLSGTIASSTSATTQANNVANTTVATTAYVTNKVTELIGGAPGTLDTLNELAAAINDDSNYNSTLTTALATKLPLAGGTLTGHLSGTTIGIGVSSSVGISGTVADLNSADLGPGYLILARDDTADAAQIRFAKNGSVHSYLETRSTGLGFVTNSGTFKFEGGSARMELVGLYRTTHNIVSNSYYDFLEIGSNRTVDDYGGVGKGYMKMRLRTPGPNTDGNSSAHAFGDFVMSFVDGADLVMHDRFTIERSGQTIINQGDFSSLPVNAMLNVFGDGESIRLDGTGNTTKRIRFRGVGAGSNVGEIVADGSLIIKNEDANAYLNLSSIRNIEYQVTSGNGTAGHHIFTSYNTEIMRIDGASNRVGIGNTAPTRTLDVDSGSTNVVARFRSSDGTAAIELDDTTGTVELSTSGNGGFNVQPNGGSAAMTVNQSGNTVFYDHVTISGSNHHLFIGDGVNNRIYFDDKRALEGGASANTLQIAENFQTTLYQSNYNTFYGDITPDTDNVYDLGTSSYRWRNIYTGDLHLSNEGSKNDVDGTSGNWTIQEGENDLFIINNKTGKKFKFSLEEVE